MEKKDILVVEDNEMNQFLIQTIFENKGYSIKLADNGFEALEILKVEDFNIIIMDLMMPVMNGYEATTIIRNELKLNTPVIAVTADVTSNVKQRCVDCGMNDYISKPYDAEVLIDTVKKYLK